MRYKNVLAVYIICDVLLTRLKNVGSGVSRVRGTEWSGFDLLEFMQLNLHACVHFHCVVF